MSDTWNITWLHFKLAKNIKNYYWNYCASISRDLIDLRSFQDGRRKWWLSSADALERQMEEDCVDHRARSEGAARAQGGGHQGARDHLRRWQWRDRGRTTRAQHRCVWEIKWPTARFEISVLHATGNKDVQYGPIIVLYCTSKLVKMMLFFPTYLIIPPSSLHVAPANFCT